MTTSLPASRACLHSNSHLARSPMTSCSQLSFWAALMAGNCYCNIKSCVDLVDPYPAHLPQPHGERSLACILLVLLQEGLDGDIQGWQHGSIRCAWGVYQIQAAPEGRPSVGARKEAAEVATPVGMAEKTNRIVVALPIVDDHCAEIHCRVAIDLVLVRLYFEDDLQVLLSAGPVACLCYGCWIIFTAPRLCQQVSKAR